MSWGTCYSASNNIHFSSPPLMADGRNFGSWQPEAVINDRIQKQAGIRSSWEYRQYMVHNAAQIMKFNNLEACTELGLPSHSHTGRTNSKNTPHMYRSPSDHSSPSFGYCKSDLKSPYLSREQLQCRMITPIVNVNVGTPQNQ